MGCGKTLVIEISLMFNIHRQVRTLFLIDLEMKQEVKSMIIVFKIIYLFIIGLYLMAIQMN